MNIEELKSIGSRQNAVIAKQQKQIDALAAGLQKVNERKELTNGRSKVATSD